MIMNIIAEFSAPYCFILEKTGSKGKLRKDMHTDDFVVPPVRKVETVKTGMRPDLPMTLICGWVNTPDAGLLN